MSFMQSYTLLTLDNQHYSLKINFTLDSPKELLSLAGIMCY